jgi:hypothetical protein
MELSFRFDCGHLCSSLRIEHHFELRLHNRGLSRVIQLFLEELAFDLHQSYLV